MTDAESHPVPQVPQPGFDAEAYVRTAAPAVGLALDADEAKGVANQVERAAQFASIVAAALDDPTTAPAPVFAPGAIRVKGTPP